MTTVIERSADPGSLRLGRVRPWYKIGALMLVSSGLGLLLVALASGRCFRDPEAIRYSCGAVSEHPHFRRADLCCVVDQARPVAGPTTNRNHFRRSVKIITDTNRGSRRVDLAVCRVTLRASRRMADWLVVKHWPMSLGNNG
jgi:hypothetical protein